MSQASEFLAVAIIGHTSCRPHYRLRLRLRLFGARNLQLLVCSGKIHSRGRTGSHICLHCRVIFDAIRQVGPILRSSQVPVCVPSDLRRLERLAGPVLYDSSRGSCYIITRQSNPYTFNDSIPAFVAGKYGNFSFASVFAARFAATC